MVGSLEKFSPDTGPCVSTFPTPRWGTPGRVPYTSGGIRTRIRVPSSGALSI